MKKRIGSRRDKQKQDGCSMADTSSYSEVAEATSSSFCGGTEMACVCLPSGWSEDDSSGRRLRKELFVCRVRSFRCFWKASIGAGRRGPGRRSWRCE